MVKLELDAEDAKLLREVLTSTLSELGYEIANTDSHDFREKLRAKQSLVQRLVDELGA